MTGESKRLCEVMEGSDKRFAIPVYQRVYSWKLENCKQLYDDLVRLVKKDLPSHFFGSIVYVYNPNAAKDERLVIDGQQRLTTITLLLLALSNLLEEGKLASSDPSLKEKLLDYVVDRYAPSDTKIKLKPVKRDNEALGKLFGKPDEYINQSDLTINYQYFYNRILQHEVSAEDLFAAFKKLYVIDIKLNSQDDPQLIFESLNSTGVSLSDGDRIRNYILMGLTSSEQTRLYETYWKKIEDACTTNQISAFVRDYLSLKQRSTPSFSKIYTTFKDFVSETNVSNEDLLIDLLKHAKYFETLRKASTGIKKVDACILRLNRLETTVTRPFFFDVLRMHEEKVITDTDLTEIFATVESFLFRRVICDVPTNALNKIFLVLHRDVFRLEGNEEDYVAKFKYVLSTKTESGRFPNDAEFVTSFTEKPVYTMNSKNKLYIFERFENQNTVEDKDIFRHIEDGTYSIEHVMPQHLTDSWVKALGSDYLSIHDKWLHRIANLTLTGYNSKYSNDDFIEKRDMQNGFADSGLRMNLWIAMQTKWTEEELIARNEKLMEIALKSWPMVISDYKPAEKQLDSVSLDDDTELTGRIIAKFSFKGLEQPVASWVEMYCNVLKQLHNEDKSILTQLAFAPAVEGDLSMWVSNKQEKGWAEIESGIYVYTATSTNTKLNLLKRFFKLFSIEESDLVFILKDGKDEDELSDLQENYFKYWEYALPIIKEANAKPDGSGPFSGANYSKETWVSGFFGIGGCNISCIATTGNARVQLYIKRGTKDEIKAAFDNLYARKDEIEKAIGSDLLWFRKDEFIASCVEIELENVNAWNEADYDKIAHFHAEWSKKFVDVLVPYLSKIYTE